MASVNKAFVKMLREEQNRPESSTHNSNNVRNRFHSSITPQRNSSNSPIHTRIHQPQRQQQQQQRRASPNIVTAHRHAAPSPSPYHHSPSASELQQQHRRQSSGKLSPSRDNGHHKTIATSGTVSVSPQRAATTRFAFSHQQQQKEEPPQPIVSVAYAALEDMLDSELGRLSACVERSRKLTSTNQQNKTSSNAVCSDVDAAALHHHRSVAPAAQPAASVSSDSSPSRTAAPTPPATINTQQQQQQQPHQLLKLQQESDAHEAHLRKLHASVLEALLDNRNVESGLPLSAEEVEHLRMLRAQLERDLEGCTVRRTLVEAAGNIS